MSRSYLCLTPLPDDACLLQRAARRQKLKALQHLPGSNVLAGPTTEHLEVGHSWIILIPAMPFSFWLAASDVKFESPN